MEGVLPKVRCQIIADFYGENVAKWETFSIGHFMKMECKKNRHLSCNDQALVFSSVNHFPYLLLLAKRLNSKSASLCLMGGQNLSGDLLESIFLSRMGGNCVSACASYKHRG